MGTREMKAFCVLAVLCLSVDNGLGYPLGRYMFVKCNPDGDQANCVPHRSQTVKLNPDLPNRLPASSTHYLEVEPVPEEEWPVTEEEWPVVEEVEPVPEEEWPVVEEVEPVPEEGSGWPVEGSAMGLSFLADPPAVVTEAVAGSGDALPKDTEKQGVKGRGLGLGQELKEDHLLL